MIDLHTHSIFSDGELLPSELVRRAEMQGYKAVAITDHADASNVDFIIPRVIEACQVMNRHARICALAGIEITHVTPVEIPALADRARQLGAQIIVVHGETIMEPVKPGTNRYALESDIDILAHPGFITLKEAETARKKGICLEITCRKGHAFTNGWVARVGKKAGAMLVCDTDTHRPEDLADDDMARKVILGAGLTMPDMKQMFKNSEKLVKKALARKIY